MNYIIVTPAKDEEKYIEYTLKSVCAQTLSPRAWIIVNDGSKDNTAELVLEYARNHPWITLIDKHSESEQRSGGGKVVRAFYVGYNSIKNHDYDFIVKLDADLGLPENYFEEIAKEFKFNPKLGMCGGICVIEGQGRFVEERWSYQHIRGPLKAYRKECFQAIGGLKEILGWDGIDEIEATMKGWDIKVKPSLRVLHYRKTSSKINKGVKDAYLMGRADYKVGYDIFISLLRCVKRSIRMKPYVISGFVALIAYYSAFFTRTPKIVTQELGKHANRYKYQYYLQKCLKHQFQKTTKSINQ